VLALARDLALITVYPTLGVILFGAQHAQDAAPSMGSIPVIYWFGWTATAALGALVFGCCAALLPERWTRPIWSGWLWVAPVSAMVAVRLPHPTVVSTVASSNCSRATRSHAALTSIGTFRVRPGFLRLLSHGVEVPGRAANNANDGGNPWHALSIRVVPRSALDRVMERINIAVP
jgi:hypothetical protein